MNYDAGNAGYEAAMSGKEFWDNPHAIPSDMKDQELRAKP